MGQLYILVILGVMGLVMGSFAGATTWRLRARQLVQDKAAGEEVDRSEYKQLLPLTKSSLVRDRSRCLHCGHVLAWYDLVPLASWISTAGKCRYCHASIGWFEPLIELATALLFVLSYLLWPATLATLPHAATFGLWLVAIVLLVILFTYDIRWFLLPNVIIFPLLAVATVVALFHLFAMPDTGAALISLLGAIAILSGIYFVLWLVSKGAWIGFGDVKLGLALALLLGQWQLAFVALFAANIIGCLVVLPGMMRGKITRKTRIPFGPLLIAGGVVALLAGDAIINWYFMAFL